MHVVLPFGAYDHMADLMAEARHARLARADTPKRSVRTFVASLFTGRGTPVLAPAAS